MKKLFQKKKDEEHNFWVSYTDLMAGFIIIFIIISVIGYQKLNSIDAKLKGYSIEEIQKMIEWHETHGNMVNINDDFKDVFEGIQGVEFVKEEGSIRLYPTNDSPANNMLFKVASNQMEKNLSDRIYKIGRKFVQRAIQLKKEGKNIAEIRIEGHTDPSGYFFGQNENGNLMLSSRRAYTVFKAIFDCCQTDEEKQFVLENMISVGYSSQKPIPNKENPVYEKCRRIEFRIISK